jgi:hypothetical protein
VIRRCAAALILPLVLSFAGCRCEKRASRNAVLAKPPEPLAPLSAPSWLVDLEVPGFEKASAAVPLGATEPRPVVIALHGDADRPEWQCGTWAGIAKSHPFVLCPRGVLRKDVKADPERYGWGTVEETERELRASLRALKSRFGKHVASGSVVIAAFGAGVKPAAWVVRQEPAFFARVVFIGVGSDDWSPGYAGLFAAGQGRRMLFVCSDPACDGDAERYLMMSRGAGIDAKLVNAGDFGRQLDRRVASALSAEFTWLVEDDPRYPAAKTAPAASAP